jgi:hypothetical protein
VPLEFLVPSLHVVIITNMTERGVVKDRLNKLMYMEEDKILEGFHQEVQKERDKSWRRFKEEDIVLLFESKFFQHPGKFRMHWLEPYEVKNVTAGGSVQLKYLRGT